MRIRGIAQTKAALARVQVQARAAAPTASKAAAGVVGRNITSRAPRNTGATATSVRVFSEGETAGAGPTTSYARFPEFGTRFQAAQNYMADAADASEAEVVTTIAAIMKAAVEG
jgi:HK97 gp10 family phage protein